MTSSSIFRLIKCEEKRQKEGIELIASENYVSKHVLEAAGSVLTNKYAEGYPHHRYYGGCEVVDEIEEMAINNALKVYNCAYANVQPYSGSQANTAVFSALLEPGDTILGLDLNMGGHLTHGSPVNFSGKLYRSVFYGLDPRTFLIDYNQLYDVAKKEKPKVIICGASSYVRDWDYQCIRKIADEVGACVVADISHPAGLIAKHLLNDPFDVCHIVTSTSHKTLRGPRGGLILMRSDFENPKGLVTKSGKCRKMSSVLNSAVFPGMQGGPLIHIIAAKAIALGEVLTDTFTVYARQVIANAQTIANSLMNYGFNVVSGGTDNHIVLIDLCNKGVTGKEMEDLLGTVDITVNKNMIPFDKQSPAFTSGIRIGTSAVTSRGLIEEDMKTIASFINECFVARDNASKRAQLKQEINRWMRNLTIYPEINI